MPKRLIRGIICGRCGERIKGTAKRCPHCGNRIIVRWEWRDHFPWAVATVCTCGLASFFWYLSWINTGNRPRQEWRSHRV